MTKPRKTVIRFIMINYLGGTVKMGVLLVLTLWPTTALGSYYLLLLGEPVLCLILILIIARLIDKKGQV
jgi:hypothetical protein